MGIIRWLYNTLVRERLPKKISVYNGVAVRDHPLLDLSRQDVRHDYEASLVGAIREKVTDGDDVAIVGGGWGVSSVVAARQSDGSVTTFEGADKGVERIEETLKMNQVAEDVIVNQAVVGADISTWGSTEDVEVLPATELPACDVLVLDCEGAEIPILEELEIRPRVLVVETHGMFDAPEAEVRARIEELEYEVVGREVEDAQNGVVVLTAEN